MTRGPTLPAHRLPYLPNPLDAFNAAPADEARALLLHCLRSLRWSHRVADHRPYPDLDSLLAAADEAAYDLSPSDMAEALAGESLPELPEDTYSAAHMALSAAQAAYEARFGHAFVIYLGDTHPDESLDRILEAIRSRLTNDPEEERVIAAEELRRLARGRLLSLLRGARLYPSAAPPRGATSHDAPAHGK
ncbi:2-oxo-4-hydroxy-4-carboxy--5-ureidoimidazoline (OHCU) decarboxylase [Streptomyces puniciscabiei]|uniref:2-oxo-4-hydroxy-4-carboxy--5-ureidoimidazoline (OHCU) decarboxylase n=1 Tax=Streptomyces puniciscabiei TaxID=164348 RepID=A0A542UD17_9ACTN|nr:2-oxo-4-hydroxy-4-carboxy-5-ureidoimidazoline decarboxylase [Streptomyces puniciscabiei]TQK96979.1 2-oxo-4-hydroxy-4-carboxy--5-ureidoimidazoline (OHCU) decarboxylase [Streptomyces puniciscabiei]